MIEFVQSGYLEVFRDGIFVSRHREERKAIQSVLADAEGRTTGAAYEIRPPVIRGILAGSAAFDINASVSLP